MRLLIGLALVAALAVPSIASAQNATPPRAPQADRVSLPAAAGYCAIDRNRAHEVAFADTFRQVLPNAAALSFDCRQAEIWRQAGNEGRVPTSLIVVLRLTQLNADQHRLARGEAVARHCANIRGNSGEVAFGDGPRWLGEFQAFAQNWRARNSNAGNDVSVSVGFDANACYLATGMYENNKLSDVTMLAATMLRGRGYLIMALQTSGGFDANRLAADHVRLRSYMQRLVQANANQEQAGPRTTPPQTPVPPQAGLKVEGRVQAPNSGARLR